MAIGPLTHPVLGLSTFVPVNANVAADTSDERDVTLRSYRSASAGAGVRPIAWDDRRNSSSRVPRASKYARMSSRSRYWLTE